LRIACVVQEYAPHVSGSDVYAQGVSEALARRGHEVSVICRASDCAAFAGGDERIAGVRVWRGIGAGRRRRTTVASVLDRTILAREAGLAKRSAFEYEAALHALRPDIVLALPVPRQSVVGAARYARRTGCPAVVVPFYHIAFDAFVDEPEGWLTLLGSFAAVLATTAAEEGYLRTRHIPPDRIHRPGMFVRPTATPSEADVRAMRERLGASDGLLVASAATQFSEPKGSLALARAAAVLPHVTFAFLGGSPRSREWLAREVPLGRNVHLLGFVSENEKAVVLAAADLFALPSRADAFGIAYQEAHALGTPSLALDLPAMREVIGPAGFYVDPSAGEHAVTRTLAELASNPDRLDEAAKAAPEVARRYAPEPVLGRICALVEEVAARR